MSLTLALIKPDAVQRNLIGNIITLIEKMILSLRILSS